ncbi:MAG: 50S ribosomal protein L17 [Candidatus Taylorbacteria bacterium RIFCSPLOWO2_01_FULL_44_26]|uniref:Large ribosomal subunit protein bL17 n=2 Tax=Candidatus Tayloriibacteriota TaxID=1817919 RepID=A0A1G2ML99_9BACT|nr:MAG: 50S ribosomal protein L17 [Candidatus Taylorbacteria bacterium RIFCSPHIGHO2_02_FULL_44_12]OHA31406.1 MAG: 50S ribosomal protein L17 [Candidatus Taylorbacteria bacterium RIFCSPLOWO2_01_FULL_44_26]
MRHHNSVRKFGREKTQRHALMRSLARNLIRDSRIRTTVAKAKELRPFVEKLITKAKSNTLASRRLIISRIHGTVETTKLFVTIAPKYTKRSGGYTRIIRLPNRDLDGSPMALIEFV